MKFLRILATAAAILGAVASPALAANCSGTIATGGSPQNVNLSSNTRGMFVMNNSVNLMCISFSSTAAISGTNCAAGSYPLNPGAASASGGSFASPQNFAPTSFSIISSNTGDIFSCDRY